jgi:hypothetical protein
MRPRRLLRHQRRARAPGKKLVVPPGTRLAVVLENGISTPQRQGRRFAVLSHGVSVTHNNQVVIPVGSYLRGSLLESKRPGRIKGHGEFRMRLESLIFPNGYTVDLLAAPRSAIRAEKRPPTRKEKLPVRAARQRRRNRGDERLRPEQGLARSPAAARELALAREWAV